MEQCEKRASQHVSPFWVHLLAPLSKALDKDAGRMVAIKKIHSVPKPRSPFLLTGMLMDARLTHSEA